jgi:hypothetical protein
MKRNALVAIIGVFLLGLIGGTILGRFYLGPYRWRGTPERKHLGSLPEELGLSDEQRREITPIMDEARGEIFRHGLESLENSGQAIDRLENRIRPFLQPDQITKLEGLTGHFRKQKERRSERLKRRLDSLRVETSSR